MTKQEITIIICRSIALYIGITAIIDSVKTSFPYLNQQFMSMDRGISQNVILGDTSAIFTTIVLSLLVPITVAFFLWIRADWISKYMIQDGKGHRSEIKINADEIQTIIFSSIGLFLLTLAFPQFVAVLFAIISQPITAAPSTVSSFTPLELVYSMTQIIIGGWLLIKASTLVYFLHKKKKVKV